MTSKSFFISAIVGIVVITIGIASFFGYRAYSKRSAAKAVVALATDVSIKINGEIERSVKGLAQQVSEKVSAGLRGGAITAAESRRYSELIEHVNQQLAALEGHRKLVSPALFDATHDYITDGGHLLRRIHTHAKLRGEVFVELGVLDDLRRQAGTRSGKWISDMVATKKKLDQTAFEYRNAVGTLDFSLTALANSRRKLAVHLGSAQLVREELVAEFQGKLTDSMVKLINAIEGAATLDRRR
jgi:hypothetical protein